MQKALGRQVVGGKREKEGLVGSLGAAGAPPATRANNPTTPREPMRRAREVGMQVGERGEDRCWIEWIGERFCVLSWYVEKEEDSFVDGGCMDGWISSVNRW